MHRKLLVWVFILLVTSFASAQETEGRTRTVTVPVFAHYVSWHLVPGGWATAASLPLRRDNIVGGYSSFNPDIIAQHNAEMSARGIMPMVSWWARDSYAGDPFLDAYLPIPGPKLGILYEAVGPGRMKQGSTGNVDIGDPANANIFISDMEHLQTKYFDRYPERFYRIDGRPVVFIWISHSFVGSFEQVVASARERSSFYLVCSNFATPFSERYANDLRGVTRACDAISSYSFYNPQHYSTEMGQDFLQDYSVSLWQWHEWLRKNAPNVQLILPLNFSYDERKIPGRQGLYFNSSYEIAREYAKMVRDAAANPCGLAILPVVYLTSYNEHYEGTAVEPSVEYQGNYLDIISDTFALPVTVESDCANKGNPRR